MRPCCCGKCRLCWLYENDLSYRSFWNQTAVPEKDWPWSARAIGKMRTASDRGLGDTLARNISRLGLSALSWVYERLVGEDCGCTDRQLAMNNRFPYA